MALTTRTLPALQNGISRQPPILRSPDQSEDELNTWGKIATGLSRRPPTETIKALDDFDLGDATVHHINRDINERYTVIIDNGGVRVFDETTGLEKTVTAPLGWGYLDAPGSAYRAVTIADYTFIVNTEIVAALKGVGADQTAQDTNLVLPGGNGPIKVVSGSGLSGKIAGIIAQYDTNVVYSGGLTGQAASMEKLPDPPCSGCVYKVLGDGDTSFVSYYVRGDGVVWNETVSPGLKNAIDETTMPHALIRLGDGTFKFIPFSWQPRRVGDHESNPAPPFIGRTIRDIFLHQNRLGFLVDESIVFSAAGDYGDFWRRTVLDYIDSDTLAAAVATNDVNIMDWAVPFSDGVMLFSRQKQFSLTYGDSGLSAHSLSIQPVTSYVMAANVKPTPMGSQVHFVSDANGAGSVQEYTRLAGADPTEAAEITAHVPGLLPQGASQLIPASDLDSLFVLMRDVEDEADRSKIFVYQFFWDGDKKLQSSWRVWDFGDGKPVSGAYESGSLHLLMERPDGFFLERIQLGPSAQSEGQDHLIYLDRQDAITGVYDGGTDRTTFTLPFEPDADKLRVVLGTDHSYPEAVLTPATYTLDTGEVSVPGDFSAGPATIGHLFTTTFVFSRQYPVDWQQRPLTSGRLQLHTFTVNYVDSVYFRAEVYPYSKALEELKHIAEFAPTLGSVSALLGEQSYRTGSFVFSIAGNSVDARVELINDSPFSSTFTSAEWEGLYFQRAL